MAYPSLMTIADVEAFYSNIRFSDTTKPGIAQIEKWIAEATAFIYSAISDAYTVPVTDNDDLEVLKAVARMYVMEFVAFALNMNRSGPDDKRKAITPDLKMFYEHVQKIKTGDLNLPNSAKKSRDRYISYNSSNDVVPVSSKSENLW